MAFLGTVEEIWRYPVSSIGGERLTTVEIGPDGIEGDRCWCIVDSATGAVAAPEKEQRWRPSVFLHARLRDHETEIGFPDGDWLPVTDARVDGKLSAHFDFEAAIRPYAKADTQTSIPVATNRYEPSPLHLITTGTLNHLASLIGVSEVESKRFRPTFVLQTDNNGEFHEQRWLGRRIQLGPHVIAAATEETKRCGLTLIAQPGVTENPDILRTILRQNRRNFGIYGNVERSGAVTVGDGVHLLNE